MSPYRAKSEYCTFVAALMNSIIADIAVLNRMPSISSVTCKAHKMISNE
jgi:hypothetical protein